MSEAPSSSELTKRIRTGIPLAAGIALVVFAPTFVVGLVVLVLAFIGAQELTAMLAGKEDKPIPQFCFQNGCCPLPLF